MNKFIIKMGVITLITLLILNYMPLSIFANEETKENTLNLQSQSAILIDQTSGEILYEHNAHEKLAPASVTKIMTMLLTMEAIENKQITLEDEVTISQKASSMGGTQLFLEPFEVRTVEELLYGVAVESANDACAALAEYIGGSYENFVVMMNEKARELGMENTSFKNSNGLPEEGHYTTAYDIALMTKEICDYPDIFTFTNTWMKEITIGKEDDKQRVLTNTNKMLQTNSSVDGMKTGYTSEAGHCISATASKGDFRLISVILKAPDSSVRFEEANMLLEYGFNTYESTKIVKKDTSLGQISISRGREASVSYVSDEDITVLEKKTEKLEYDTNINLKSELISAPIKKGDILGTVTVTSDSKEIGTANIIAVEDIEKISFINYLTYLYKEALSF